MSTEKEGRSKAAKRDGDFWVVDPATGNPTDPMHPWNRGDGPPMLHPFRRKLLDLETAFRFRGVKLAALEAMLLCQKDREPWPAWLHEAALAFSLALFAGGLPKSAGRTGNDIAEYREYLKCYVRWATVDEFRGYQAENKEYKRQLKRCAGNPEMIAALGRCPAPELGTTWDECFKAASEELRGTFAQAAPDRIEASYKLMKSTRHPRFPNLDQCARLLGVAAR